MTDEKIAKRFQVFTDADMLDEAPSAFQLLQGSVEMLPYVTSTDATAERHYRGAPFAHSLLRQPLIFSKVGIDHLRTGSALGAKLGSLIKHLLYTYHEGMPVFDLQLIQTHHGGLERLEREIHSLLGDGRESRKHHRFVSLFLPKAKDYYEHFVGQGGWIERARAFDYASSEGEEGSSFPSEFFSLLGFADHCAKNHSKQFSELGIARAPKRFTHLLGRRFREGKSFGWFQEQGSR
jgi:hypothetical protein